MASDTGNFAAGAPPHKEGDETKWREEEIEAEGSLSECKVMLYFLHPLHGPSFPASLHASIIGCLRTCYDYFAKISTAQHDSLSQPLRRVASVLRYADSERQFISASLMK